MYQMALAVMSNGPSAARRSSVGLTVTGDVGVTLVHAEVGAESLSALETGGIGGRITFDNNYNLKLITLIKLIQTYI